MNLSMSTLTLIHVAISLVGVIAGFAVIYGFLRAKRLDGWNALFLITTIATSVTGFLFPRTGVTPGQIVGAISLLVLMIAIVARYPLKFSGTGRWLYVVAALLAQYLNVFVLIVQSFQKVGALKALAPTQSEPLFLIAQGTVLVLFALLGIVSLRNTARS